MQDGSLLNQYFQLLHQERTAAEDSTCVTLVLQADNAATHYHRRGRCRRRSPPCATVKPDINDETHKLEANSRRSSRFSSSSHSKPILSFDQNILLARGRQQQKLNLDELVREVILSHHQGTTTTRITSEVPKLSSRWSSPASSTAAASMILSSRGGGGGRQSPHRMTRTRTDTLATPPRRRVSMEELHKNHHH